jgi:SMC interacting uncharacterized protein involved in chromosome segregation
MEDQVVTHYSASKIVTWVSAIVIPLVAGFAWVANTSITVHEQIVKNLIAIEQLSKNQSKLIDITDRLNDRGIASDTLLQTVKEDQHSLAADIKDILNELRSESIVDNKVKRR